LDDDGSGCIDPMNLEDSLGDIQAHDRDLAHLLLLCHWLLTSSQTNPPSSVGRRPQHQEPTQSKLLSTDASSLKAGVRQVPDRARDETLM